MSFIRKLRHKTKNITISSYTKKAFYKKHWTDETINARGHVVADDGRLLSCPFPKLFNLGEVEDVSVEELIERLEECPEAIEVREKYNGHLAILFYDGEEWLNTTKGSFEHDFIEPDRALIDACIPPLVQESLPRSWTLMFEIIGQHDRHLLTDRHMANLGGEAAVLIGVNNRDTRQEVPTEVWTYGLVASGVEPRHMAFPITAAQSMRNLNLTPSAWIGHLQAMQEREGVVLLDVSDGWYVKIKTDWFFRHRYLFHFSRDKIKDIFITHGRNDQAYEVLPEELYDRYTGLMDIYDRYRQYVDHGIGVEPDAPMDPEDQEAALRDVFWDQYGDELVMIFSG